MSIITTPEFELTITFITAMQQQDNVAMQNAIADLNTIDEGAAKVLLQKYITWHEQFIGWTPLYNKFIDACNKGNQAQAAAYLGHIKQKFADRESQVREIFVETFQDVPQSVQPQSTKEPKQVDFDEMKKKFMKACKEGNRKVANGYKGVIGQHFPQYKEYAKAHFTRSFSQSK